MSAKEDTGMLGLRISGEDERTDWSLDWFGLGQ